MAEAILRLKRDYEMTVRSDDWGEGSTDGEGCGGGATKRAKGLRKENGKGLVCGWWWWWWTVRVREEKKEAHFAIFSSLMNPFYKICRRWTLWLEVVGLAEHSKSSFNKFFNSLILRTPIGIAG